MLRVAVPNKGSLSLDAAAMLKEAGYRQRRDPKELVLADAENGVEFFYLRPRDIAVYVGAGTLDLGITGRDLLLDSGASARELMALGFGGSTFRFAARPGEFADARDLAGRRVATSYPRLVDGYLRERGVATQVVRLEGAVETAVRLNVADVIADVVETGGTLRAAGLEVFGEPILRSEAVLIGPTAAADAAPVTTDLMTSDPVTTDPVTTEPVLTDAGGTEARVLLRRLSGVLVARQYVLMDYDVPVDLVEKACAVTPGLESPTVSPLHDPGWAAVRVMVPRSRTNVVMDDLYALGARAILVTSIHACRL